jgi:hypothetical protein
MLHDAQGFATPFATDDAVIEAGLDDPDYGDPAEWPAWTDQRVEVGPAYHPEPAAGDVAWLNSNPILPPIAGGAPEAFEPTDQDWDDMYAAAYGGFTDEDLAATGLSVG